MYQTKVLIVDDSFFMQRILGNLLASDPEISVVGTAKNGEEALSKIANLHPDVVTMDIEMPKMDGLTAVQKIMETNPLPIVMISALTQREAALTLKALELGAVDYLPKPSGPISLNMDDLKEELIAKVKTASFANIAPIKKVHENVYSPVKSSDKVISIAASTGGPFALSQVLKVLPSNTPPILIVQHMPKGFTKFFAESLGSRCMVKVKEAEDGDRIQAGLAMVAPAGYHMVVNKIGKVSLTSDPPVNFVRPSADVTMISVAEAYGAKNIGVVLTGMGSDGARGLEAIKKKGGVTIAQDQETSVIYGMPRVAYETGCIDIVASLDSIPKEILKACN